MGKLICAATGFTKGGITLGLADVMRSGLDIILRTRRLPAAELLDGYGIEYDTLDDVYEDGEDFAEVNDLCAEKVLTRAESADVLYCVLDIRDASVAQIIARRPGAELMPGVSEEGALFAYAGDDALCVNASDLPGVILDSHHSLLVRELDSRTLASECKLTISDCYPEECVCTVSNSIITKQISLYELDRMPDDMYSHTLSLCVPAVKELTRLERYDFTHLLDIVRTLRAPGGCPWDREQTHASLRQDMLEEAYEAADAIDNDDPVGMCEELGDVLLQVMFHTVIGEEFSEMEMRDVTSGICRKMISRHPHVFGDAAVSGSSEVPELWQKLKMTEKKQSSVYDSMDSVARALPALIRAQKICKRGAAVGFCAGNDASALERVRREIDELAAEEKGSDKAFDEFGDVLLAVCACAVRYGISAEEALEKSADKYMRRFGEMEKRMKKEGFTFETVEPALLDRLWDEVKADERNRIAD